MWLNVSFLQRMSVEMGGGNGECLEEIYVSYMYMYAAQRHAAALHI